MSGPPRGYPYGYAPPGYYAAPPGYVLAPPPAYAPPPPRVVVRQTADRTNVVHVPPPRPSGDPMRAKLEGNSGRAFFWTQDEEQNLRALVGALGTSQWATVAERLGTQRSAAADRFVPNRSATVAHCDVPKAPTRALRFCSSSWVQKKALPVFSCSRRARMGSPDGRGGGTWTTVD